MLLFATACTKEETNKIAPDSKNLESLKVPANMYHRSLVVNDRDGKENITLRFSAASKEVLDNMPLDDFTFKVVEVPTFALDKGSERPSSSYDLGQWIFHPKMRQEARQIKLKIHLRLFG
jgi:hypothetical protein